MGRDFHLELARLTQKPLRGNLTSANVSNPNRAEQVCTRQIIGNIPLTGSGMAGGGSGMIFRGAWDVAVAYAPGDLVQVHQAADELYVCVKANTGVSPDYEQNVLWPTGSWGAGDQYGYGNDNTKLRWNRVGLNVNQGDYISGWHIGAFYVSTTDTYVVGDDNRIYVLIGFEYWTVAGFTGSGATSSPTADATHKFPYSVGDFPSTSPLIWQPITDLPSTFDGSNNPISTTKYVGTVNIAAGGTATVTIPTAYSSATSYVATVSWDNAAGTQSVTPYAQTTTTFKITNPDGVTAHNFQWMTEGT